jgi:hypothetical protein
MIPAGAASGAIRDSPVVTALVTLETPLTALLDGELLVLAPVSSEGSNKAAAIAASLPVIDPTIPRSPTAMSINPMA